jgi:carbon monoxide dehydrogenase subunit G
VEHQVRVAVGAPPPAVFDALLDGQRVARCFPGFAPTRHIGSGEGCHGHLRLRKGSLTRSYALYARASDLNPSARTLALDLRLSPLHGGEALEARILLAVIGDGEGSALDVRTDAAPAALEEWRGLMERVLRQFGANLEALVVAHTWERPATRPPTTAPARPAPGQKRRKDIVRRWVPLLGAALVGLITGLLALRRRARGAAA